MSETSDLYCTLLTCCHTAFNKQQYLIAYHSLSAAMYCCLQTKDVYRLEEVIQIAYDQLGDISERFGEQNFPDEPLELSLYRSLVQMTRSRLLLFRK